MQSNGVVRLFIGLIVSTIAASGCAGGNDTDVATEKKRIANGHDQGIDQCVALHLLPGCDLCAELGYYGDGFCDSQLIGRGLCLQSDGIDCAGIETLCQDGLDNDGDGIVDCMDSDCAGLPVCQPAACGDGAVDPGEQCDDGNTVGGDGCTANCTIEATANEICNNGVDDDSDGLLDCNDPDCSSDPSCVVIPPEDCMNRFDDDGDGLVDCNDPDCASDSWCNPVCGNGVVEPGEDCDDGNNQSGDGCSASCLLEGPELCDNGWDDDGDGLVDCADPDCAGDPLCGGSCGDGLVGPGEECDDGNTTAGDGCSPWCLFEEAPGISCQNGIDDDRDGLIDCSDPDCASDPACP